MRNSPVEELFQNISTETDIIFNIIENLYEKNSCEILLTKQKSKKETKSLKLKSVCSKRLKRQFRGVRIYYRTWKEK